MVVERLFGIFLDAVAFGARVWLLVVQLFNDIAIDALAEWIVVFLKRVAVVKVPPSLDRQRGVVAVVSLHELGIEIGVVGVGGDFAHVVKVHLLDGELVGLDALGCILSVLRSCQCCYSSNYCDDDKKSFHSVFFVLVNDHTHNRDADN